MPSIALCRSYCRSRELDVRHVFSDRYTAGDAAHDLDHRDGLWDALLRTRSGWHLVMEHRSHLSLWPMVCDYVYRLIDLKQARLQFVNGSDNAALDDILTQCRKLAQRGENARRSHKYRHRQARGYRVSSAVPYGTMVDPGDPKRLIMCPEEREVCREIVRLHREDGHSARAIANIMMRQGVLFRGRKPWHHSTVRRILKIP